MGLLLIRLSSPAIIGTMVCAALGLVDTFFISRLGSEALAALTLCIPILILITSIASATGIGLTSLIARTLGSGDLIHADNVAWHGLIMSFIYGLIIVFVGTSYCDDLLVLAGSTQETLMLSWEYLQIVFWGSAFIFIPICMTSIIQGEGNILLPMLVSIVGIGINVLLDPIFIFGFGPIKAMGLNGAAVATILSQAVMSIIIVWLVIKKRKYLSWSLGNYYPSLKVVHGIYKVGLPALVIELAGIIIMAYLNKTLANFGYTAIAVLGIFFRIRFLVYVPVYGLAQGAMPIASFAYGSGNKERVKETLVKASVLAVILVGLGWMLIQVYPVWVISIFSNDPVVISIGSTCLWLSTIFLPLMGPLAILYTILQAVGKGVTAMYLSLLRQLVFFLPLLIILPEYFGLKGVWMAFAISELLSVIVAIMFTASIWRELDGRTRSSMVILLNPRYFVKRVSAWVNWNHVLW